MFKLLAIDLDGTLLTSQKSVTDSTRQALLRAYATGIDIALASGRSLPSVLQVMDELGLSGPRCWAIACNGALVRHRDPEATLAACMLEHEDILTLSQFGRDMQLECYQLDGRQLVAGKPVPPDAGALRFSRMPVVSLPPGWEDVTRRQTPKMMFVEDGALLDTLAARIPSSLTQHYHFVRSEPHFFDIMRRGVNKGAACKTLADHLGVTQAEILALGDEENDREMLDFAGMGIAMGNASPSIKMLADAITASNDDEGVRLALERYILC